MSTTIIPASDKQIAYIKRLLQERNVNEAQVVGTEATMSTPAFDKRAASRLIDYLSQIDRKPTVHDDGNAVSEGYYLQEDTVYKVVKAKSAGNLYAKALHSTEFGRASWDYAPGAMKHLAHAPRLTLDQAREMGTRLGACVICGKALTDPESIDRGIGPVCAARI